MILVSVREAQADFSRPIDRAVAGEEVIITRKGGQAARLVLVEQQPQPAKAGKRPLGLLNGEFEIPDSALFDPLPDEFLDAFYNGSIFPSGSKEDERQP